MWTKISPCIIVSIQKNVALGKLSEYDIYVEDINGELEECYEMMYKEPVQESDIRGLVLDTVSKFYHNIRDGRQEAICRIPKKSSV